MRSVPISSGGGDPILYQHLFYQDLNIKLKSLSFGCLPCKKGFGPKGGLASKLGLAAIYKEKDTTADNFYKYYSLNSKCYGKIKQPSSEFFTWFIGFSEGDGSFVKSFRGDLHFVIVPFFKRYNSLLSHKLLFSRYFLNKKFIHTSYKRALSVIIPSNHLWM